MVVIGVAGGIGTGKSEVSRILGELGAAVLEADKIGHEVYLPHTEGWREVVATFGEEVLLPTGEVDRRKLGGKVFGNPQAMEKLNAITRPRIRIPGGGDRCGHPHRGGVG
ncbi:MAG: dephospho-CoA kinase [Dehalococcoidia bacterium]|nr:dephospho-CoA kinase [Dehalococcoidia bacterium]